MSEKMVELYGVGFQNRGAQLMLETCVSALREARPVIHASMEPDWSTVEQRRAAGLLTLFPAAPRTRVRTMPYRLAWSRAVSRFIPNNFCINRNLVRRQDIDGLIDMSGYAFGDGWGPGNARRLVRRAQTYWEKGKPVILMPQMLGPFQKPGMAEAFAPVFENATKIYARDRDSFRILEETYGTSDRVELAPDITIFTEPQPPANPVSDPYGCLVPNIRMLDQGGEVWGKRYEKLLRQAAEQLIAHGLRVAVVIHSTDPGDRELANRLLEDIGPDKLFVCDDDSPARLKGFISEAEILIGSRFHALVGAVSCAVPSIAMGWSHKYEQLMGDFNVPEYLFRASDSDGLLQERIASLLSESGRKSVVECLRTSKKRMITENTKMWSEVISILN